MKILFLAVLLTACTPTIQTVYVPQVLTHDPAPILPTWGAHDLDCVPKDVFQKIYDRDRLSTGYALYLQKIIDSTKEEK